ncbi:MAG: DUF4290 domain-containing protein [Bacteroidales bacterium]|nr:DUF4290 domain-containing protein [Candidatus Liminaster caballi]
MQQYNTQLSKITLPEYGRRVQELIRYCKTIPDRGKRTAYAHTIVEIMADLYPEIANVENSKQILWDHLALISNYELDVDYPFQITPKESLSGQPVKMTQNEEPFRYMMYGRVVEQMIEKVKTLENPSDRIRLLELCANHMKRNFHLVNKDADEDNDKIINDLVNYVGIEYKDEVYQVFLYDNADLKKNDQYDPARLVEPKKKKKKKK